ncbi:MAG: hypothetical protein H0X67_10765 [Acidobacteria bacterium]|nr:hypothetical protein [Acidobacteriota bacterium]
MKKPPLQRRTISVPVPELPPGKYKLVIIAESRGAVARSEVLAYEVR